MCSSDLGAAGSGYATAVARFYMVAVLGWTTVSAHGWQGWTVWPGWRRVRELLRLGVPVGLQISFEVAIFALFALSGSLAVFMTARVLLGAYLFGGVTMLQFHLQGAGVDVPSQLLSALPYIATIVVLALISRNPTWIRVNMPASLGKAFHPGS